MAVGDQQRLVFHFPLNFFDQLAVGDAPETALVAVVLLHFQERCQAFNRHFEPTVHGLLGLRVEREDRT